MLSLGANAKIAECLFPRSNNLSVAACSGAYIKRQDEILEVLGMIVLQGVGDRFWKEGLKKPDVLSGPLFVQRCFLPINFAS